MGFLFFVFVCVVCFLGEINSFKLQGTPRRSTSSLRESFFSDNENEENLSTQSALTKDESLEDYEPNSMKSETPSGIGQEATIRYLRAQLRALQEDLSKSVSERKSLEEELAKSRKKLQSIEEDQKKTKRTANATDKELDKSKKVANSAQERIKRLEAEVRFLWHGTKMTK